MPTIYEIASRVGVSTATVSRALTGKGPVRPELRERILDVAKELDYHPNSLARGLITKRTHVIGLVLPDINNPFFPALARGVEDVAHRNGYNVILCNTDSNAQKEAEYLGLLRSRQVDGVILTTCEDGKHLRRMSSTGLPVVVMDRKIRVKCDLVVVDNSDGAAQATRHLISLGHSAIGVITGPRGVATGTERLQGYARALIEAGLRLRSDLVVEGDYRHHGGYQQVKALLRLKTPPTAIFAFNDLMAIGALAALEEQGLRVPSDIALVGYDDTILASTVRPMLTTVAQPKYEIGAIAAETLLERIGRRDMPVKQVVLKPHLVIRDSTIIKTAASLGGQVASGGGV